MQILIDIFDMGKYNFYIWTTYVIATFIFVMFYITTKISLKNSKSLIKRHLRRVGK